MGRAEIRRLQREQQKAKKTYTLTQGQIGDIKKQAADEAIHAAFILMCGLPLMALRDKFGFGKVRLERFSDALLDLYDSFDKGYVTLEDLHKTIFEETGVKIMEVKRHGNE